MVRRRARCRGDRGDQPLRRPGLHRQRPARRGHRPALGAARPRAPRGADGARARCRRVRHLRPGGRRLRGRRGRPRGRRGRGRGVGVLDPAHRGLRADLRAQARDRGDAPGGHPAQGPGRALRLGLGPRGAGRRGSVLP